MLAGLTVNETFAVPHAMLHRDQFRRLFKRLSLSVSVEVISEDLEAEAEEEAASVMMSELAGDLNFHSQKGPHFAILRAHNDGLIAPRFIN